MPSNIVGLLRLLKMIRSMRHFDPGMQELTTRRKDEISIRGMRSVSAGKKRDLTIPGRYCLDPIRNHEMRVHVGDEQKASMPQDPQPTRSRHKAFHEASSKPTASQRGSRDDVLEPSVYDLARESARVEGWAFESRPFVAALLCLASEIFQGTREGAEEEKQEEQTSKAAAAAWRYFAG